MEEAPRTNTSQSFKSKRALRETFSKGFLLFSAITATAVLKSSNNKLEGSEPMSANYRLRTLALHARQGSHNCCPCGTDLCEATSSFVFKDTDHAANPQLTCN